VLIALEGIDGSGTTTQLARLAETLRAQGREVHTTAEPSKGPIGLLIRKVLSGELPMADAPLALLFAADRLDHLAREIEPALARGAVVVSDRYLASSLAYQAVALPRAYVASINDRARPPDLTLFLRVSGRVAAERRAKRGGPAERFDADKLQEKIAQSYEEALKQPGLGTVVILDGDLDPNTVAAAIARAVAEHAR
jgi:dTMP kinase